MKALDPPSIACAFHLEPILLQWADIPQGKTLTGIY